MKSPLQCPEEETLHGELILITLLLPQSSSRTSQASLQQIKYFTLCESLAAHPLHQCITAVTSRQPRVSVLRHNNTFVLCCVSEAKASASKAVNLLCHYANQMSISFDSVSKQTWKGEATGSSDNPNGFLLPLRETGTVKYRSLSRGCSLLPDDSSIRSQSLSKLLLPLPKLYNSVLFTSLCIMHDSAQQPPTHPPTPPRPFIT